MTVEVFYAPTRLNADGIVADFAFTFIAPTIGDVKVTQVDANNVGTLQVLGVDYTVVLDSSGIGGVVTRLTIPPATDDILMELDLANTQITDIPNVGGIQEEKIEVPLDRRTLVSQLQQYFGDLSIKLSTLDDTNIAGFNKELTNIVANAVLSYAADGKSITSTTLAALGAIGYPVSNGIAIATGAETFIARQLAALGSATIDNADGVSGNPTVNLTATDAAIAALEVLACSEQDTPDDTVKVTAGYVLPINNMGSRTDIAAGAADALTFPVIVTDPRIDLFCVDDAGVFTRIAGAEAVSPVAPQYPDDRYVLREILIDEDTTVVINDTDITRVDQHLKEPAVIPKEHYFTRDTGAPSGTQVVAHGLKGVPKSLSLHFYNGGSARGSGEAKFSEGGVAVAQSYLSHDINNNVRRTEIGFIMVVGSSSYANRQEITVAVDDVNVTFTFTEIGTVQSTTGEYSFTVQ